MRQPGPHEYKYEYKVVWAESAKDLGASINAWIDDRWQVSHFATVPGYSLYEDEWISPRLYVIMQRVAIDEGSQE